MADIGTGTTISFASGFFAEILNVNHSGISRESIDDTHMGTTAARSFQPSDLYDPGELSVELQFDDTSKPPISDDAEQVTVTFPSGTTWQANGFMTGFEYSDPLEDKMTATATLKFSGEITVT